MAARLARAAAIVLALAASAGAARAQPALVSVSAPTPAAGNVSTLNVPRPGGVAAGDVLIAMVAYRGGTGVNVSAVPSGWTQVTSRDDSTRLGMHLYYKVAGASEPASYTWTLSSSNRAAAAIMAFRGVDTASPIAASGTRINGASTALTAPSITPGVAGSMLVAFWGTVDGGASVSAPAAMTGDFVSATGGGSGLALAGAHESFAAATATGTRVATASIAEENIGFLVALRPAPVVDNFLVEAAGGGAIGPQVDGAPFALRITARDASNATVTSFTGTVAVTSSGTLAQGAGSTASFVGGVLVSHTVALTGTGTFTITATDATTGASGTSASFTVSALSAFLRADFRMEETAWSGAAGEVIDSSSNGYHGRGVNATTAGITPAVAGSPGTCRYGVFNRSNAYVELPATFPNLSGSFAIAAWIRPTSDVNGDQRIFADDEANGSGFGFSLGDGGSGQLRFFGRSVAPVMLDSAPVITVDNWYFVAAVHDAAARTRTIYAYNAAGTLLGSWSDSYTGTWGTDSGRASIGGETAAGGSEAVPRWRFGGNIDELKVYDRALTQAQVAGLLAQTHPCAASGSTPGGFNAFETSTASAAITGVIKTKIAGSAFSLAVVALNAPRTAVLTTFTGTVTVELLAADDNTGALNATTGCRSSWTSIGTIAPNPTFTAGDNGRDTVSFSAANAWREVRVRVTYSGGATAVVGCSTDSFAIRPASFAGVQATDGSDTTTGVARVLDNAASTTGVVHRAGRPFSVLGAAVSSTGTTTTGYDGTPSLAVTGCTLPAGCTAGTFTSALTAVSGSITGTANYSEAGVITATLTDSAFAAIDAADSTLAERTIASGAITIGRFVPEAYRLSTSTPPTFAPPLCGAGPSAQSFVFVGQGFSLGTAPTVLATPVNFVGQVLANARPRFGTGAVTTSVSASGAPVALSGSISASAVATSATATISFTGTSFSFTRGSTPVASFTPAIAASVDVSDTTETGTAGNTAIGDEATLTISPIAFSPAASPFHYGRIQLYPALGDYRRDLVVPLEVQAWNGLGWMPLTAAAACVSAGATAFAYSQPTGGLADGGGTFNCATRVAATVTTSNGRAAISLANPPNTGTTQPSAMTMTLNLLPAASGQSCSAINTGTAATTSGMPWLASPAGANPSARVTWGRTRGDAAYVRERFD